MTFVLRAGTTFTVKFRPDTNLPPQRWRLHVWCFRSQLLRVKVAVALLSLLPALLVHLLLEEALWDSHNFQEVVYAHTLWDTFKRFLEEALLRPAKFMSAAPGDNRTGHQVSSTARAASLLHAPWAEHGDLALKYFFFGSIVSFFCLFLMKSLNWYSRWNGLELEWLELQFWCPLYLFFLLLFLFVFKGLLLSHHGWCDEIVRGLEYVEHLRDG